MALVNVQSYCFACSVPNCPHGLFGLPALTPTFLLLSSLERWATASGWRVDGAQGDACPGCVAAERAGPPAWDVEQGE